MWCTGYVNCTNGLTLLFMAFCGDVWPECGIAKFLTLLDGPWATLIVRNLLEGPARFTELKESLPGISAHTLTNRLRKFEESGLVTRTVFAEIPPRVVYELTETGQGLRPVLESMNAWALAVPSVADAAPSANAHHRAASAI